MSSHQGGDVPMLTLITSATVFGNDDTDSDIHGIGVRNRTKLPFNTPVSDAGRNGGPGGAPPTPPSLPFGSDGEIPILLLERI